MSAVSRILDELEHGHPQAAEQLLPLVYDELRKLAAAKLSQDKPGQTMQPTVLVHEAYLRLVGADHSPHWNGRGHFFGAAAEAMRRILIENARRTLVIVATAATVLVLLGETATHKPQEHATAVSPQAWIGRSLEECMKELQLGLCLSDIPWGSTSGGCETYASNLHPELRFRIYWTTRDETGTKAVREMNVSPKRDRLASAPSGAPRG